MTRILIPSHEFAPFHGGIASLTEGLAAGTAAIGHEPIVLAPDYGGSHAVEDAARPYRVIRFAGSTCSMLSADGLLRFATRIRRAVSAERPDVVHAADPQSHMALTALSRIGLAPRQYSCTVHGTELLRYRRELFLRLWMARAFRRTARIAVVSEAVRGLLVGSRRLDESRIVVAPPGIARDWQDGPAADRNAVRAEWHAAQDAVVLFTLSRLAADKGHEDVIAALAVLGEDVRGRVLYVVAGAGAPAYAARLTAAATAADVRLLLLGEIDDAAAMAACDAADLFVMLSRRTDKRLEGFGIAYVEAAARGLPALARGTGGVKEAVRDGETGIVIPEDAGTVAVANAVRGLIADAALRHRLGAGARRFAASFGWDRHAAIVFGADSRPAPLRNGAER